MLYIVPRPLGMESGAIKDSQINASSEAENGTRDQSRLNSGPEKAWCVQESDSVRTLTIDLQKPYYITQVRVLTGNVPSPPPPPMGECNPRENLGDRQRTKYAK